MKRSKTTKELPEAGERIKLKVDSRTVIVVRSHSAMEMWMKRYPGAQIVE
ncbi:MAG: hypothetical protein ACK5Z2_05000 [Bacteroidota bacterium]|jgi:hypothetical protein